MVAFEPVSWGRRSRHHVGKRGFLMRKISFAVVGAAALALAACGGKQENAVENVDENLVTDNLEAAANEAATINETDTLANQEEALNAEAAQTTTDEADQNAANVNAM